MGQGRGVRRGAARWSACREVRKQVCCPPLTTHLNFLTPPHLTAPPHNPPPPPSPQHTTPNTTPNMHQSKFKSSPCCALVQIQIKPMLCSTTPFPPLPLPSPPPPCLLLQEYSSIKADTAGHEAPGGSSGSSSGPGSGPLIGIRMVSPDRLLRTWKGADAAGLQVGALNLPEPQPQT